MINTVLFDWFDTLAQYYPLREEMRANVYRELGIEVDKERLAAGIVLADHYYLEENARSPMKQRPPEQQMEIYAQMERIVLKHAGVNVSDEVVFNIMQAVGKAFSNSQFMLFDDVLPALDQLKKRDLTLGIISNLDRDLRPICQELGLASYLDLIVTSKEVGHEKPHPPIFLAALEQAGAEAAETMYVGDHYATDVVGAQRVGMKGVLLDRHDSYRQVTGCHRIRTLADLVHCL
jgi:putative hydrolase of the HAD superfamily